MIEAAVPARLGPETKYGLGVIVRTATPVGPTWGHSGFFPGYQTELLHVPDLGLTLAIQINTSAPRATGPRSLLRGLYDIAAMVQAEPGVGSGTAMSLTMLCIATYKKGDEFLRECHRQGCRVLLVTEEKLRDADWPREAIDAFYYVQPRHAPRRHPQGGVVPRPHRAPRSHRRARRFRRRDGRDAARVPARARHGGNDRRAAFRDKLAMRIARARGRRLPAPSSSIRVNHEAIHEWTARVSPPWVLKPRSQAAAIGIKQDRVRRRALADPRRARRRSADYVLEQFVPGDVYHVDSLVFDRRIVFAAASRYGTPPMAVAHEGGIFVTRTLSRRGSRRPNGSRR